jgi:hypothetical protein
MPLKSISSQKLVQCSRILSSKSLQAANPYKNSNIKLWYILTANLYRMHVNYTLICTHAWDESISIRFVSLFPFHSACEIVNHLKHEMFDITINAFLSLQNYVLRAAFEQFFAFDLPQPYTSLTGHLLLHLPQPYTSPPEHTCYDCKLQRYFKSENAE